MNLLTVKFTPMQATVLLNALTREEGHVHTLLHENDIRPSEAAAWVAEIQMIHKAIEKARNK